MSALPLSDSHVSNSSQSPIGRRYIRMCSHTLQILTWGFDMLMSLYGNPRRLSPFTINGDFLHWDFKALKWYGQICIFPLQNATLTIPCTEEVFYRQSQNVCLVGMFYLIQIIINSSRTNLTHTSTVQQYWILKTYLYSGHLMRIIICNFDAI